MKNMYQKLILCLFLIGIGSLSVANANNVQISGISVLGDEVTFNLSWENSWNSMGNVDTLYPNNYDAVWLFVKVQPNTTNLWQHQKVNTSAATHSITASVSMSIEPTTDGVGVFVRRTNPGSGNIASASVTLKLQTAPTGTLNLKVFGIEMVRIPQGTFHLGDGIANSATYPRFKDSTVTATRQASGFAGGGLYIGSPITTPSFPLGYNAMYSMKYEITNEQFMDFLNTLTYDQQANHIDIAPNSAVNTKAFSGTSPALNYIRIQNIGVNNTSPAKFGCNFNSDGLFNDFYDGNTMVCVGLDYKNFQAYLDWSGMRPMTETEFEKICRGTRLNGNPVERVAHERAWGSTNITNYTSSTPNIVDLHSPDMKFFGTVVNGRGFLGGGTLPGRAGMFADTTTGREAAGASFYGVMNMSDNAVETVVCVVAASNGFFAQNGDGILSVSAEANQSAWPEDAGYGYRGGYYNAQITTTSFSSYYSYQAETSCRVGCPANITSRPNYSGGRGVR